LPMKGFDPKWCKWVNEFASQVVSALR
jgi:hypothetical protein